MLFNRSWRLLLRSVGLFRSKPTFEPLDLMIDDIRALGSGILQTIEKRENESLSGAVGFFASAVDIPKVHAYYSEVCQVYFAVSIQICH